MTDHDVKKNKPRIQVDEVYIRPEYLDMAEVIRSRMRTEGDDEGLAFVDQSVTGLRQAMEQQQRMLNLLAISEAVNDSAAAFIKHYCEHALDESENPTLPKCLSSLLENYVVLKEYETAYNEKLVRDDAKTPLQ